VENFQWTLGPKVREYGGPIKGGGNFRYGLSKKRGGKLITQAELTKCFFNKTRFLLLKKSVLQKKNTYLPGKKNNTPFTSKGKPFGVEIKLTPKKIVL